MRNFIDIITEANRSSRFPAIIDVDSLASFLLDLHHTEEDFVDGDLLKRLYRFSQYELRELPLAEINIDEWAHDPETAIEYSTRGIIDDFPPIVYDAVRKTIIDGTHRANAAVLAGEVTIPAYVGVRANRNTGPNKIHTASPMFSNKPTPDGWESSVSLNRAPSWKRDW